MADITDTVKADVEVYLHELSDLTGHDVEVLRKLFKDANVSLVDAMLKGDYTVAIRLIEEAGL